MNQRQFAPPHGLARAVFLLAAVLCFIYLSASAGSSSALAENNLPAPAPTPTPVPTGPPERINFDPAEPSVAPGNRVIVKAKVLDRAGNVIPETDPNSRVSWKIADSALEEFIQLKPTDHDLTAVGLFGNLPANGPLQTRPTMVPIIVSSVGNPAITNVVNIHLTNNGKTPGPTPPGLKPQVDIMWSVMPDDVVHDNFGSKISKEYYCIELLIGNNSGYDLQIAGVGFTVPQLNKLAPNSNYIVPATGYKATRGSIERAQQVGTRAKTIALINGLGPLLTGFTPFFHVVNHRSNFSELVNIFSNPFEKGFEAFYPDTIIGQLGRLEEQALRNDVTARTIVPNNTQIRTVTFLPKNFLNDPKSSGDKEWRKNPQIVMTKLGKLVLIGEQVEHINRVRVVSESAEEQAATEFAISGRVADRCGNGVQNVNVKLSDGPFFKETTAKTDADGNYRFPDIPSGFEYTVAPEAVPASFTITGAATQKFMLIDSHPNVNFTAALTTLSISGKVQDASGNGISGVKVEVLDGTTVKGTATSDSEGNYSITGLPAGVAYTLKATGATGVTFKVPSIDNRNCNKPNTNIVKQ